MTTRAAAAAAIGGLLVTACATKTLAPPQSVVLVKQVVLTREVPQIRVLRPEPPPRAKRCMVTLAAAPTYPDDAAALRKAPTIYEQVQLLLAGRALRMERERTLTESLKRCAN